MIVVNPLAVLVSAVVFMAAGMLWYSPLLFGKAWAKMSGFDMSNKAQMEKMKKEAGPAYFASFVGALVLTYVLGMFMKYTGANTLAGGALIAFWAWLGFIATTSLSAVLYSKKPMKLWMIDAGYHLVTLLIAGMIMATWQ